MNHVQENINVEIRRIRKMIQEWIELPSFADGLLCIHKGEQMHLSSRKVK